MNYLLEIENKVTEFCNIQPTPDLRVSYLEVAPKVHELRKKAILIGTEEENEENKNQLIEIFEKISKMIDEQK